MTTFALVHGAFHGGWCFGPLAEALAERGHRAVAPDLPCEDPSAGCSTYADVVVAALAGVDDDVVVVGHSIGGLTAPIVAARRPARGVVYLCAFTPQPGRAFVDWSGEPKDIWVPNDEDIWPEKDDDGLMRWPADKAVRALYPDCTPEVAAWAAARLRRQSSGPHHEACPLDALPDVPAASVFCTDDLAVAAGYQRRVAAEMGLPAHELPGGHSPFLSRPGALADVLVATSR